MQSRRPRAAGFTLLELMLASVIAAVLLCAALAVLVLLSRDRLRATAKQAGAGMARPVPAVLVRDLTSAQFADENPTRRALRLYGYTGSAETGRLGGPVRVTYRVVNDGGLARMTRSESRLDEPAGRGEEHEVVMFDVTAIDLRPSGPAQPAGDSPPETSATRLGSSVSLSVTWLDGTTTQQVVRRY